jgi:AAA domain
MSLKERLGKTRPAVEYRIDQWFVVGGHVVLVAQYKAGKTTLVGNLVRSLVDGEPFLGVAKVKPVSNLVILDFEMSEGQVEMWLRDQNIRNTDRVYLVSLRGAASSFDILNPLRRREWAERLRELRAEFAFVDCLRPAMDALGLDEHNEAGLWLTAFDEMLRVANIPEALIVHHSGHGGDRSRGDSRILDWPDGIWSLVRENRDNLNSPRFISAKGRDISVDEGELSFDAITRHLTYAAKNRKKAGADRVMVDVLREVARAADPMSIRDVTAAMRDGGHSRGSIEGALQKASDRTRGYLSRVKGPKGSHLHSITAAGQAFLANRMKDADEDGSEEAA